MAIAELYTMKSMSESASRLIINKIRARKNSLQISSTMGAYISSAKNNMFGSLSNTSKPDSPVALNYGNMRVAGQFLSGYILSQQHAQNDAPTVASIFNANQSPLSAEAEEAA